MPSRELASGTIDRMAWAPPVGHDGRLTRPLHVGSGAQIAAIMVAVVSIAAPFACTPFGADGDGTSADQKTDGAAEATVRADADLADAAPPARFCPAADSTFCEDFDDGNTLPGRWIVYGDYPAALAKNGGLSAPHAMHVQGVGAKFGAAYVGVLKLAPIKARFAFAVQLLADAPRVWFAELDWDESGGRKHGIRLEMSATSGIINEFDGIKPAQPSVKTTALAYGSLSGWHDVTVDIDWGMRTAIVSIDASVISMATLAGGYGGGSCFVQLGAFDLASPEDGTVHRVTFDNVSVR